MVTSATMNPPTVPRATSGATDESAVFGSPHIRDAAPSPRCVATVQINRIPVLLTVPDTVMRSPSTKPSVSNAD